MYAQLRKVFGFALLFALVFGTVSAERAVALPAVACPDNTIMVNTDTPLTVADADRAAMEADPPQTSRQRTMQELFNCAMDNPGSTVQFADGTYDDVGRIVIGGDRNSNGDDPNTPNITEKVTFRGNSENREAVKLTGEVGFRVEASNILIEYITFENTENVEMSNWPHVTEIIRIDDSFTPNTCHKNVEIRNCVLRNTRGDGIYSETLDGKSCNVSGLTVADSLFENIGYNNEWEDGYGLGDTGTGIPKLIPATVEGATTHKSGTTLTHVNQSRNYAIRLQGDNDPFKNVTITGNTINGTTHSGIVVHRVTGGSSDKIEISNNIVNNVPRSGISVLEGATRSAKDYKLIIKNNLVVNSGTSPWLVSDYGWYADGLRSGRFYSGHYLPVKSILGGGTTDKVVDRLLKPEIWSYTENIVEDGTVIFGSDAPPVNIYDNFGGAGNPTDDRASEYGGNGNRVSTSSSKIPASELATVSRHFDNSRADSCIEDDDSTSGVDESRFACFSVIRFLDPYAAGAIQLNGVSTTSTVEIEENELRDNTLGLVLCGGSDCYFNSPYSAIAYASNNAAYAEPDISMNNIYGESAMSAADRAELPTEFAMGAVYASIGDLTDKLDLDGNYLGQDPELFTDPNSESLNEVSEYTGLASARLDIAIPLRFMTATVTGNTLTLTYSEALDSTSVPAASDFTVMVDGEERDVTAASVSGATVTLTLASAVAAGDAVTVSYTPGSNPIQDTSTPAENAATLTARAITNNTPPALTTAVVNRNTLTLTYNDTLDSTSVPAASDFTVMVGGEAGPAVTAVSVSGAALTLTLASAVENGDTVTASYTPGSNPIRNASRVNAVALTDRAVTNNTPPALTSAVVNRNTLTLTYNKALDSTSVPATGDFTVMVEGEERDVTVVSVSGATVTLTLASAVENGDEVTLSYTPGSNPIRDASRVVNAVALTDRTVRNNTSRPRPPAGPTQPTPPALTTAAVAGDTLTLTYSKTLDSTSVPAPSDFTVMVDGEEKDVTAVSVSGATVRLTLASAVETGDEVTISYTPGNSPIRDESGMDVPALDGSMVSGLMPMPPCCLKDEDADAGCALASGRGGTDPGMLLALMVVSFGFAAGRRAREAR